MPNMEICITVPAELFNQLKVKAEQSNITVEELVIRALVNALED